MIIHYVKTAVRNLLRYRFFSAINVFGLAVAMSICMAIIMLVGDQMSYDRHNPNAGRIYRVNTLSVDDKGNVSKDNPANATSCMPIGPELLSGYTSVERVARLRRGFGNSWLKFETQDVNIPISGFYADAETLDFFQYALEYGDASTALAEPFSVVLTREASDRLFKEPNPLGKTIQIGDLGLFTVTGILQKTDNKSHIVFDALGSMSTVTSLEAIGKLDKSSDSWFDFWQSWTYVQVAPGTTEADLQRDLDIIYEKHIASSGTAGVTRMKPVTQSLLSITPGQFLNNLIGPQLPWELIYFLGGLALIILLTSCFNFTNLSIARSLTRAREIGVRKVTGAARSQIFFQFLSESIVLSFVALGIALFLLTIIKPMILQLSFAQAFHWDLTAGPAVYAIFFSFTLVVGTMAGFFPAVVLSGFEPIKVLKNLRSVRLFSRMGMRKALLISQFTLSLFFIVTVIVLYNQLDLFTHQEHGFNIKNNILVRLNKTPYETLKHELEKYNNIASISAASHLPAAGITYGAAVKRTEVGQEMIDVSYFLVDENYLDNMNLKLVAGEFFNADQGESRKSFVVINQACVRKLNFDSEKDAIGQPIIYFNDSTTRTIIGVVADYNHRDLMQTISPAILLYDPSAFSQLQVAYVGTLSDATKSIEKAWATVNPGLRVDYTEVQSEVNRIYDIIFGDLVGVIGFISFLAILISCLGLLGMSTYSTESRMKEISIRKVLGASGLTLVLLLSRGFLVVLGISVLIGLPLAWFVNDLWLSQIAYHTYIGPGTIAVSVLLLVAFGVITVGSQTIRATFVKPTDNLKSE